MDIKQMTLKEKIGQMLCLSFHGTEYNSQLKSLVEEYNVGTIIHFARNITSLKQVYELNYNIHKNSKYPVFIGLDHEGGMVRRVMNDITYLPGAMAMSNSNEDEMYKIYNQVGKELRKLLFNMNYMPSVDVNNNPLNPVINSRSYSDKANLVAKNGKIAAQAMQDSLVLPTPKHFPGHGNTNVDSHLGLPIVDTTKEELYNIELKPFEEIIKNNIDGIMVAHILFKEIDDEYPSSISKKIITDLLKNEMGFKGLIITDSLTMKAIYTRYSVRDIIKHGINAGNDIIMFCGEASEYSQEVIVKEFVDLVEKGEIPISRIDESVNKIMKLKEKYKITLGNNQLTNKDILENFNKEKELSHTLTKKSVSLYKDENKLLPIKNEKILSLFPKINLASLVDNSNNEIVSIGKILNCDEIIYEDENCFENIVQKIEKYDKIILATYNTNKDSIQTKLYNLLKNNNKLICVALRSPFDILYMDGCKTYICTFDCTKESINALCECLKENTFSTKLPINLDI